jgi:hypothetical protein
VVTARLTVPVKPFRGVTVIVELDVALSFTVALVGFDVMPKSAAEATR